MKKIKYIIKLLTPIVFFKIRKYITSKTFEGVYDKLDDVPMLNDGYRFQSWIETMCKTSEQAISDIEANTKMLPDASLKSRHYEFLPFLVSVLSKDKKKCTILDFGGGAGAGYIDCLRYTDLIDFEFHIVETSELFLEIKKTFQKDKFFVYDSIPDLKKVDIVNICSALQYLDNYSEVLVKLLEKNPRFVLLTNHYMGDNETYATKQVNVPNVVVPYLIFNLKKIIEIINSKGYSLVFKSTNPQNHRFAVPNEYKVEDSCNLLFSKIPA